MMVNNLKILLFVSLTFLMFQFLYTPSLKVEDKDIKKIKLGTNLDDVLNITDKEKNRTLHLFGYRSNKRSRSDTVIYCIDPSIDKEIRAYYSDSIVVTEGSDFKYKYGLFEIKCENRFLSLFYGSYLSILLNKELKVVEARYMKIQPDVWQILYHIEDTLWFNKLEKDIRKLQID